MSISNTHLKLIQLGDDYYYLAAYRLLDESGNEHSYEDIIAQAKLEIRVVDTLPTPSEQTLNAIYLVQESGTASGTYTEYITVRTGTQEPYTYTWEKIGTTETDLSDYSKNTHYHNVTPETVYLTAAATNGSVNVSGTQNFVVDYPGVTTDVSLVNSLGSVNAGVASDWGATVDGNGVLSFSWSAGTPTSVTLPTFNNVTVLNSLGTANVASAVTGISAMVQPTITLTKSNTNSTNAVSVANNTVIQSTQAIAAS